MMASPEAILSVLVKANTSEAVTALERVNKQLDRADALLRLEATTRRLDEARAAQDSAMRDAASCGCSLRELGRASGLSFSAVGYRLRHGTDG